MPIRSHTHTHVLLLIGIDYLASIGLGAFLASTLYFVLYGLITRNRPLIPKASSILPALLSGVLCSIGQSGFLVANEILKASIVFPIAATVPGAIAALIGTVFYREVQVGKSKVDRNLSVSTRGGVGLESSLHAWNVSRVTGSRRYLF